MNLALIRMVAHGIEKVEKNVEIMATSVDGTKWVANLTTVLQNGKKMYDFTYKI